MSHLSFIETEKRRLPVVPLRDMVVFPHMMAPFIIGREPSVAALEQEPHGIGEDHLPGRTARSRRSTSPGAARSTTMGVVASVVQNLKLPNGNVKVMVEGLKRAQLTSTSKRWTRCTLFAEVELFTIDYPTDEKLRVYISKVLGSFEQYAKMSHHLAFESLVSTIQLEDVDQLHGRNWPRI